MKLNSKFNCPITTCRRTYDQLADQIQHVRYAHNNQYRARYLLVDLQEGRIWTEDRLPSKLQESAKEQLLAREIEKPVIKNVEQLPEITA